MRIAIVGLGKIARDQHLPAILATPGLELAAVASPEGGLDGVAWFPTLEALLARGAAIDAVALCTPPQIRRRQAALALAAGLHVMLEKPPGIAVSEVGSLVAAAERAQVTLFAAWHSRFAPAVEPARALIASHGARAVGIEWKEDVRVWHPGQAWIWQPGGLGVFDAGINALSILTRIVSEKLFVTSAELSFPSNRDTPIAADFVLAGASGLHVRAAFDFRQTGPQRWDIAVQTDAGALILSDGGAGLTLDGRALALGPAEEYRGLYRRFQHLVGTGASDVDVAPLAHVADAFLLGHRVVVAPFDD